MLMPLSSTSADSFFTQALNLPLVRCYLASAAFDASPANNMFLRQPGECTVQMTPYFKTHRPVYFSQNKVQLEVSLALTLLEDSAIRGAWLTPVTVDVSYVGILDLAGIESKGPNRSEMLLATGNILCAKGWKHVLRVLTEAGLSLWPLSTVDEPGPSPALLTVPPQGLAGQRARLVLHRFVPD